MPYLAWFLPLAMSLLYAVASLIIKEAMVRGVGPMRVIFLTNWILVFLWSFVFFQNPEWPTGEFAWAPFASGFCRVCGGGFLMTALRLGDVSVQTPLGGLKIVFVAIFAVLMGAEALSGIHLLAASLSVTSVFLLGFSQLSRGDSKKVGQAILYSLCSGVFFAMNDVLAARFAINIGIEKYLFFNFLLSALGSIVFVPFFRGRLRDIPKKAWPWFLLGSILLALDVIGLLFAISYYQEATTANVLYSARGIWSIFLVWGVGHLFHNREGLAGKKIMIQRLIGASLLFIAIALVLSF